MTRYKQPEPRLDVEWENVPVSVRAVFDAASKQLVGGRVTRGKVSENYSVYRVRLYVRNAENVATHGIRVAVNYDGNTPSYTPFVKFGEKWIVG